ncbi:MAG TPA: glycosyltransferase family 1 protein [Candidatus Magasanikbacteria bacterium]|nr:glycosyltransferase family 1 protein [Candidatus Magasanikbacteria bacterium]
MKIGIDARLYGPKQGGLGRYVQQLIAGLEKTDEINDYVVFLRKENFEQYNPDNPRFQKVLADIPWYGWKEQILLPQILNKEKCDFIHFPHWNIPFFYRGNFIVTIHDLILLHYPSRKASTLGPFSYFLKNIAYKFILRYAVKKAKQIITPSEFTKQDIIKTLSVPAEKVIVTYLAPTKLNTDNEKEISLAKYNITKPYLLYVGVAYPHKNLERLVRAWKIFEEKNQNFQLVLVGKKNYFYDRLINSNIFKNCKNIIFTDFIPDSELSSLYQNAIAYVFPSLYEGFGLPPLEAMQYNIPVISSKNSCLPEILGNAALYFDPKNEQDMYTAICLVLTNEQKRHELINNISSVLAKYSQENTTEKTLSVYQKMV